MSSAEGTRFGRWTVLGEAEAIFKTYPRRTCRIRRVHVRCDCGVERIVTLRVLRSGGSRSCGCLQREAVRSRTGVRNSTWIHGKAGTPEYNSWLGMVLRCTRPDSDAYRYYGGRGIKVCERWLGRKGFENFLADMGERPEGLTLDRIDVNGNYQPGNCRWATRATQTRNQRRPPKLTPEIVREIRQRAASGETHRALGAEFGVSHATVGHAVRGETWADVTASETRLDGREAA